jgi:hypothetical protein
LAPTAGIAANGFCYPGGILQLFHRQDQQIFHRQDQQVFSSTRSTIFAAADSSQIASRRIIGGHPHQQSASTSPYYSSPDRKSVVSRSAHIKSTESTIA